MLNRRDVTIYDITIFDSRLKNSGEIFVVRIFSADRFTSMRIPGPLQITRPSYSDLLAENNISED